MFRHILKLCPPQKFFLKKFASETKKKGEKGLKRRGGVFSKRKPFHKKRGRGGEKLEGCGRDIRMYCKKGTEQKTKQKNKKKQKNEG